MNFRIKSQIHPLLVSLLSLAGCVGNIGKSNPSYYENLAGGLEVLEVGVRRVQKDANGKPLKNSNGQEIADFIPISENMRVNPDEEIRITFNRLIDTASARGENFELFTDDGARAPGIVRAGIHKVDDPTGGVGPDGKPIQVHQIKLKAPGRFFLPKRRYFLLWRASPEIDSPEDKELRGIRTDDDIRLSCGLTDCSTTFVTSDEYSDSKTNNLQIRMMSPGRIISEGHPGSDKLKDSIGSYTTWVANTPIRILFSEPIRHNTENAQQVQRPEIPPTDINQFGGMVIGVVSTSTTTLDFLENLNDAVSTSSMPQFVQNYFTQTLQGKIRTEAGRRVLVFELNQGVSYPDDIAQGIVVLIAGWVDLESFGSAVPRGLPGNGVAAGAFIHLSGVELRAGFKDPKKILRDYLSGGGGNP